MLKYVDIYSLSNVDLEYRDLILNVRKNLPPDCVLAGGTLRRLIEGQPYIGADFDVYFASRKELEKFNPAVFSKNFEIFTTLNAISYLIKDFLGYSIVIQCVQSVFVNNFEELFANYDIRCCMVGIHNKQIAYLDDGEPFSGKVMSKRHYDSLHGNALQDIKDKKIVLANVTNGTNTLKRMMKLAGEGYNISKLELNKLIEGIKSNKIPLHGAYPSEESSTVNDLLARANDIPF